MESRSRQLQQRGGDGCALPGADYGNDHCLVLRMVGGSYRIGVWVHIGTLGLVLAWGTFAEITLPYIPSS